VRQGFYKATPCSEAPFAFTESRTKQKVLRCRVFCAPKDIFSGAERFLHDLAYMPRKEVTLSTAHKTGAPLASMHILYHPGSARGPTECVIYITTRSMQIQDCSLKNSGSAHTQLDFARIYYKR